MTSPTEKHREITELIIDQCEGCSCDVCIGNVERIIARALAKSEVEGSSNLIGIIADIRQKSGVGATPMLCELADAIAARIEEVRREGMKRAAEIIRDGVERPVSVAYRMDGKPSKNDKCPHDFYVYEDCEECCVVAILSEAGEGA